MMIKVMICTLDEGINRVEKVLLHEQLGVSYLISHQYTQEQFLVVPEELKQRKDVRVVHLPGKGLSRNRNNALKHAVGDIALIADDDVTYLPDSFQIIEKVFKNDPELDVACFKIMTPVDEPEFKVYPTKPLLYKKGRHHYISSIELAFRINRVKANEIWFDERFGIGAERYSAGEEEIFISDCINAGLKVMYFPFYVVKHTFYSSAKGTPMFDKQRNMLRGAVNARIHGWKAIPKAFYDTIAHIFTLIQNKRNPVRYLAERLSAIIDIFRTNEK